MSKKIDARGLECPQPVILTKKALEDNNNVTVIVDNEAARENVRRMGKSVGADPVVEEMGNDEYRIHISKKNGTGLLEKPAKEIKPVSDDADLPVIVISSDKMGRGDDELGQILMRSFIHTVIEQDEIPGALIFFNTGVKLIVNDSPVIDDIRELEKNGAEILVCGTCTNYFNIEEIGAGTISNMYDITNKMTGARRLIMP